MFRSLRWILAAVLTLAAITLGAAPRDGLLVRVSAPTPVLNGDVDVLVTVSITNTTRHPIQLLSWQLPSDEVEGALFRITRDGEAVHYTGPIVKRAAPQAGDHVRLEAGATLSYEVELTAAYDLSRNGRYAIEYASRGAHGANATELRSEALYLWLEGRSGKASEPAVANAPSAKGLAYASCKTSQQTQIATAVTNATGYAANASSYLTAGTQGARYTTWFGLYNSGRYSAVRGNFAAINTAFNTANIVVDCSCRKKNTYAYVYANQPYKIYVCGAFWSAPASGTDSKAGTLVHEMSHFTAVAGTNDYAYGQTAAKNLAISNPAQAIANADSHEYFAENTPALP